METGLEDQQISSINLLRGMIAQIVFDRISGLSRCNTAAKRKREKTWANIKARSSGGSSFYCLLDLIGESAEVTEKVSSLECNGPHEVAPTPGRKDGQKGVPCKSPAQIGSVFQSL